MELGKRSLNGSKVQAPKLRGFTKHRSRVLLYFLFAIGLIAVVLRSFPKLRTSWPTDDPSHIECLRHPLALTSFVLLILFGLVFARAPADVLRASQVLMVVTVVFLAARILDQRLRRYAVALGLFSVLNAISVQLTSGTVLRRLVVLLLAATMLVVMIMLLRKGGLIRVLVEERRWNFLSFSCYLGSCFLVLSIISNMVGGVSLADVLASGTIFGAYYGLAAYIFYTVFTALTYAFTASEFGRRSRAIRLHRDLVNQRLAWLLRKVAWVLWAVAVLFGFQILSQTISEIGAILRYKQQIGAISLSILGEFSASLRNGGCSCVAPLAPI